jgi:hypothetical protein
MTRDAAPLTCTTGWVRIPAPPAVPLKKVIHAHPRYEVTFDRDVSGCAYVATTADA